jgi:hypothetical protein
MKPCLLCLLLACGSKQPAPTAPTPVPIDAAEPDAAPPVNIESARAASKEFLDLVSGSRADIERCFNSALKQDSTIKGTTITLSASFGLDGGETSFDYSPTLGEPFTTCLNAIGTAWKMTNHFAMTFKAKLSLTP